MQVFFLALTEEEDEAAFSPFCVSSSGMWLITLTLSKSSLSKELYFDVDMTGFILVKGEGISVEELPHVLFAAATFVTFLL